MHAPKKIMFMNPPAPRPTLRDYYCSSTSKASYVWQPIDFIVQSGYLRDSCIVKVLDCALPGSRSEESVLSEAVLFAPDAIFALVGAACYPEDFHFIRRLQERINAPVVVSGDIVQFEPERVSEKFPWISYVLRDFTSPALKHFFIEGIPAGPQLWQAGDTPELVVPKDVFDYPVPDHTIFAAKGYRQPFLRGAFASILTNYGCPYKCLYCNSDTLGFRTRELTNLGDELKAIRGLGLRELFIKDMTFNAALDFTNQVLDMLLEEDMGLGFICYARPDGLKEDLARKLKRAGCRLVMLGIETGDDGLMQEMKGQKRSHVVHACEAMDRINLSYGAHFLIGLPREDEKQFEKTLTLARSIRARYASFNIATIRFGSPWRSVFYASSEEPIHLEALDGSSVPRGQSSHPPDQEVDAMQRRATMDFYLRPSYLARMVFTPRHWLDLPGIFSNAAGMFKKLFRP